MFENIIEQNAASQLKNDIEAGRLAPSMLFFGPPGSGKGSAALELARALSCENTASWKCACAACTRHRLLLHSDLLMMGFRPFQAEIAAARSALFREQGSQITQTLYIRSIRKLQARFSPVLTEDDTRLPKIATTLRSLEENLNDFEAACKDFSNRRVIENLCASIDSAVSKIIDEGMGEYIPTGHVRKAAWWCRLAPNGKIKTIIIENAERMKDEARNSLLKLLEEPPADVRIVLVTTRREAIIPTILSRLRPYRFFGRDASCEKDVIRRIFRDSFEPEESKSGLVSAYLDSFVSGSADKLHPAAVYFAASLARTAAQYCGKKTYPIIINALGERYAPEADSYGFERSLNSAAIIKTIVEKSGNFENDAFSRFCKIFLELVSDLVKENPKSEYIAYQDKIKRITGESEISVNVLNINTTLALEGLFYNLRNAISGDLNG